MPTAKYNLLGMDQRELAAFAESIGERRYRGQQLFGWLYQKDAESFGRMTDLAKAFRARLAATASIEGVRLLGRRTSRTDGATKFLFGLRDGLKIETVLIPPAASFQDYKATTEEEYQRLTLCVSTQVGCPLGCVFCATGTMGFLRNLSTGEVLDQIRQVRRVTGRRITNVVFMGMGEPLLNYENTMRAAEILVGGMGIAPRRITVSTAGWVEGIRRMAEEGRRVKLAVSLHSAVEGTRRSLMPVSTRYPIATLSDSLAYYYQQTRRRVTYEVIFFDGVNDTEREISQLVKFARRTPCKINIIPYHSIAFATPPGLGALLRPSRKRAEIVERLRSLNLTVMVRSSAGEDIAAACGQLVVTNERLSRSTRSVVGNRRAVVRTERADRE